MEDKEDLVLAGLALLLGDEWQSKLYVIADLQLDLEQSPESSAPCGLCLGQLPPRCMLLDMAEGDENDTDVTVKLTTCGSHGNLVLKLCFL